MNDHTAAGAQPSPYRPALLRPLLDGRVWKETIFCLLSLPLGVAGLIWLVATVLLGIGTSVTLLGLPLAAVGLGGTRRLGAVARSLARRWLGVRIDAPADFVHEPGFIGWVKASILDTVGWRAAAYLFLVFPLGVVSALLVTVLCLLSTVVVPLLLLTPWVVRSLAVLHRAMAQGLLGPTALSERVRRLQESRDQVVDTAAADLRRIERDLHDGAQARLATLAMDLGMAKERLSGDDSEEAGELVGQAHTEAKLALGELRDIVRGIHPAVLTDRGLDAALSSLAARCTARVSLDIDVTDRPSSAIEAVAYFAACELIANITKHSGAAHASVSVRQNESLLVLEVSDDGIGGADLSRGTGLAGLVERVEAVDGRLRLESPPGGPTTVRVDLPSGS